MRKDNMDNNKIIETLTAVYNSLDTVTVSGSKNMTVLLGCMQAIRDVVSSVAAVPDDTAVSKTA